MNNRFIWLIELFSYNQALTEEQMKTTANMMRGICQPKFKVENGKNDII